MKRQWLVTGATIVALTSVLSACSGGSDDEPEATPTKAATSAPATTAPAPEPTPVTQQPGANGVTFKLQDFEKYQDDAAVIAWTHINEDLSASINQRKLVPGLEQQVSKTVLRKFVNAINVSKKNDYTVAPEGDVKVQSSETDGSRAKLTMCMWAPTTGIRDKNGDIVGKNEKIWFKQVVEMSSSTGQWVLRTVDDTGTCPGGAPS